MVQSSNLKKILLALCATLLPISVYATGLGKLNVQSGIGEPLKADIELISITPDELSSLTAAIASEEAYASQGIERPATHNSIKVTVGRNSSGVPVLKLNSTQPISDPYLDMLLQVDWNSGRLLREYTVLLDPPGYKGADDTASNTVQPASLTPEKTTKESAKPSTEAATEASAPISGGARKSRASKRKPVTVSTEADAATAASSNAQGDYLTQKGDTLMKIAQEMKPEGVSLEQMLVGLYEANPEAFSGKNMNRLNVGKIIRQPTADELSAITTAQAKKEIHVQTADWNAYRGKLASMVAQSTPDNAETNAQSSSGKIKTSTEDKSAPPATGPKDVVKLSAGDAKADSQEAKSMQAKITALQEEATAREKSLKEAQDRTTALEKQVADMQKLVQMKSNAMAEMQKQAEAKPSAPAPTPSAAPTPAQAPAATSSTPVSGSAPAPVKPAVVPPPATPIESPSFFSGLMDDPTMLGGVGGLLAALGGGWLYLRNKRKKNLNDFEQGIMTSGGLKANTVFGNTSGTSVDTGDTSFLTDFSQSAHGGMIDTNDVDPIAEAEVYMAYGRDAQAEEILKDAISKEPKRYELHLKLLEMYAASKNMSAFEALSGELYTTLGASDPTWSKVAELGIRLEPNNPLYQAGVTPTGLSGASRTETRLDAGDFADSPMAQEADLSIPTKPLEQVNPVLSESMPFMPEPTEMGDFGDEPFADTADNVEEPPAVIAAVEEEPEQMKSDMLEFDMSSISVPDGVPGESVEDDPLPKFSNTMADLSFPSLEMESSETKETPMMEVAETSDESFDFDVPTISPEAPSSEDGLDQVPLQSAEMNGLDLSGISLEMPHEDPDPLTQLPADEPPEVETKLELVAAYMEMDDKEGAKELLAEVIKEGGAGQRKRAEDLLTQLS